MSSHIYIYIYIYISTSKDSSMVLRAPSSQQKRTSRGSAEEGCFARQLEQLGQPGEHSKNRSLYPTRSWVITLVGGSKIACSLLYPSPARTPHPQGDDWVGLTGEQKGRMTGSLRNVQDRFKRSISNIWWFYARYSIEFAVSSARIHKRWTLAFRKREPQLWL